MAKRDERGVRVFDYSGCKPMGPRSGFELPANMDDVSQALEIGIKRLQGGRKAAFPATADGLKAFNEACVEYFEYLNEANQGRDDEKRFLLPDVEGLCSFIGISRQTLWSYETTRGADWVEEIRYIKTVMLSARKQLASYYKLAPTLEIFNMANNFDYKNVSEFKLTTEVSQEQRQEALLEAKLDESGLIWDSKTGEYVPISEEV